MTTTEILPGHFTPLEAHLELEEKMRYLHRNARASWIHHGNESYSLYELLMLQFSVLAASDTFLLQH